ncbi:MAG TPA: RNA 3'-terminal phosphate cyclase [Kofleriaceae bacterium]
MREGLIAIDGTHGEGGGQLLRGALALAAATGRGFRIQNIRRARPRPGLMRQHLTAVQAAAAICDAHVEGAEVGATTLVFVPKATRAGDYSFAIGTAGSCVLVLQAIVPALARLASPSRISITGGTHNPLAPTFEYLRDALAPQLAAIGWTVEYTLVRPGFYPAGGGELVATIFPARPVQRLVLVDRGERLSSATRAVVAHLARSIGERELTALSTRLNWERGAVSACDTSDSPGNFVEAKISFANVTELSTAIGERGRTAERVAHECADEMRRYLRATAPVGEYLLDQLLVPLALSAGGELRAIRWTPHAEAQRELLRTWFDRDLEIVRGDDGVRVTIPRMT